MTKSQPETTIIYLPGEGESPVEERFQGELRLLASFLNSRGSTVWAEYLGIGRVSLEEYPLGVLYNEIVIEGDGVPHATARFIEAFYHGCPGRAVVLKKDHRGLRIEADTPEKLARLYQSLEGIELHRGD